MEMPHDGANGWLGFVLEQMAGSNGRHLLILQYFQDFKRCGEVF